MLEQSRDQFVIGWGDILEQVESVEVVQKEGQVACDVFWAGREGQKVIFIAILSATASMIESFVWVTHTLIECHEIEAFQIAALLHHDLFERCIFLPRVALLDLKLDQVLKH
mmetsp:Transcript_23692/g.31732  ORF Transcript_23692/g.31732 Transcript_23692/m.31732 type:complete len:112 (+) Transcript_23692:1086-1421(+)